MAPGVDRIFPTILQPPGGWYLYRQPEPKNGYVCRRYQQNWKLRRQSRSTREVWGTTWKTSGQRAPKSSADAFGKDRSKNTPVRHLDDNLTETEQYGFRKGWSCISHLLNRFLEATGRLDGVKNQKDYHLDVLKAFALHIREYRWN